MKMFILPLISLLGCVTPRDAAEDSSDWWASGQYYDVEENLTFTDQPYDFTGEAPISDLLATIAAHTEEGDLYGDILYGTDETLNDSKCPFSTANELPLEVEGVVTVHPRFYFKISGCDYSDEKYYGSYFIEDSTGGIFVLGDSKVAHFDQGNKVRMKVRGLRNVFGLNMVYAHDIVEVDRDKYDVYYSEPTTELGDEHIGNVQRVTGVVKSEKDDFGAFSIETQVGDETILYNMTMDAELSRRGVYFPVGTRITVTGPVIFSYDVYAIVIMRIGQVQVHD